MKIQIAAVISAVLLGGCSSSPNSAIVKPLAESACTLIAKGTLEKINAIPLSVEINTEDGNVCEALVKAEHAGVIKTFSMMAGYTEYSKTVTWDMISFDQVGAPEPVPVLAESEIVPFAKKVFGEDSACVTEVKSIMDGEIPLYMPQKKDESKCANASQTLYTALEAVEANHPVAPTPAKEMCAEFIAEVVPDSSNGHVSAYNTEDGNCEFFVHKEPVHNFEHGMLIGHYNVNYSNHRAGGMKVVWTQRDGRAYRVMFTPEGKAIAPESLANDGTFSDFANQMANLYPEDLAAFVHYTKQSIANEGSPEATWTAYEYKTQVESGE